MGTNGTTAMVVAESGPALAKAQPDATRAFEPRDISEAERLCKILVASGLLPRGIQRPEAAFAIVAAGRELGLTAMQSLRSIHIIEGKPSLSADLAVALVKSRSDVCEYFILVESSDKIATYETKRRGEPRPTKLSFTWEDAQRAGVTGKDNWKKYPPAMLRARCSMALARAVYPDLMMGVYDPDELSQEPRPAQPGSFAVVDSPSVAPVDDGPTIFDDAVAQLAECTTVAQVNATAKQIAGAHKAGRLTDAQLDGLKASVASKRVLLGAKAAVPPPPAEPSGQHVAGEDDGPVYERQPGEEG